MYVDGARQFIMYDGEPAQYEDAVDGHLLKPQAQDEVVTLRTAEKYRYVAGYETQASWAYQANQALQAGDVIAASYGIADLANSTDDTPGPNASGWIVYRNSTHAANEATLAIYRQGTEVAAVTVPLNTILTNFGRFAMIVNWYNVGATRFLETYTDNGIQHNPVRGRVSVDGGKGPETANHPVEFSVKAGADGAGSLEVDIGTVGVQVNGSATRFVRQKTVRFIETISSTDTFVPVHAFRVDPNRDNIEVGMANDEVLEFTGTGDVRVVAYAFDQSKLRDAGGNPIEDADFSTPREHQAKNSVIETTDAVAQFPDLDGALVTSTTNPGGIQVGYGSLYSTGATGNPNRVQGGGERLRNITEGDIVVFLAEATTTGDVTVEYATEQEW